MWFVGAAAFFAWALTALLSSTSMTSPIAVAITGAVLLALGVRKRMSGKRQWKALVTRAKRMFRRDPERALQDYLRASAMAPWHSRADIGQKSPKGLARMALERFPPETLLDPPSTGHLLDLTYVAEAQTEPYLLVAKRNRGDDKLAGLVFQVLGLGSAGGYSQAATLSRFEAFRSDMRTMRARLLTQHRVLAIGYCPRCRTLVDVRAEDAGALPPKLLCPVSEKHGRPKRIVYAVPEMLEELRAALTGPAGSLPTHDRKGEVPAAA